MVWDRRTGQPIHQRDRLAGPPHRAELRGAGAAGHEPLITERTGLLLDPYFSATKIAWLLDNMTARGRRPRRASWRSAPSIAGCSGG